MQGFFSASDLLNKAPQPSLVPRCGVCRLFESCQSPKMPVDGQGKKKILLLGEAPGRNEDKRGIPFCGQSGQLLEQTLARFDVDMRRDCWITNSIICRPSDNRTPTNREIEYCRPNLIRTIQELDPEIIIPLGASAVKSLIGWLWKEDTGKIGRWVGWRIPYQKLNMWICPTWHPSAIMRNERDRGNNVMTLLFERHLQDACKLKGRPWREVLDYRRQVRAIINPDEATDYLDGFVTDVSLTKKPVSADFETDRLKPDSKGAQIICCALSDGELAFSYPWHGKAISMTQDLFRSKIPKIGFNIRFEERWCRRIFGHGVHNWKWDGMLATHVLDNRPGICSLKFQSFVRLGQASYDDAIKPYLRANGSNLPNRIREVSLNKLLQYCGLDALLEWKIAQIQMQELGVKL